jgi:hypothetical protein
MRDALDLRVVATDTVAFLDLEGFVLEAHHRDEQGFGVWLRCH